jgi:soluble lytic murein transglycosylase-like protein
LFQLFLSTAKEVAKRIGIENITKKLLLTDPGLNTQIATSYLQQLVDAFNGDVRTALGAYKQGRRSVLQVGLSKSSQEYADGVLACAQELQSRGIR